MDDIWGMLKRFDCIFSISVSVSGFTSSIIILSWDFEGGGGSDVSGMGVSLPDRTGGGSLVCSRSGDPIDCLMSRSLLFDTRT